MAFLSVLIWKDLNEFYKSLFKDVECFARVYFLFAVLGGINLRASVSNLGLYPVSNYKYIFDVVKLASELL